MDTKIPPRGGWGGDYWDYIKPISNSEHPSQKNMTLVLSLIRTFIFKQCGISRHLGKEIKKLKKPTTMLLQSMHNFSKNTLNI